jgi:hypothetical protein
MHDHAGDVSVLVDDPLLGVAELPIGYEGVTTVKSVHPHKIDSVA